MNSAIERLLSLRVGEVMSKHVIEVSPHQTLAEAADLISKHRVSGAPVVDELGHCVGMLTATDFLLQEGKQIHRCEESTLCGDDHVLGTEIADETLHIDTVERELVRHHMSTAVQSVSPDTSLIEAARTMCNAHIHRLPVLDNKGHVLGLISAMDLVAAVVQAIEE